MMMHHFIIDTTACSNEWGIEASPHFVSGSAPFGAMYHVIIPKAFIQSNTLAMIPYKIFPYVSMEMIKFYYPKTINPDETLHLVTGIILVEAVGMSIGGKLSDDLHIKVIAGKRSGFRPKLAEDMLQAYGITSGVTIESSLIGPA